ncbi:MAG: TetR/AcrR family transcriptional regulator [Gammaproteobacteria bacterium]|nr:TetR/AcrR family transcriptional regulator [Gammaproteobacteria bacterium]MDH3535131.1 TetR/AcrR family transcriptional regulator [Gammaproteobacteria bacterium]
MTRSRLKTEQRIIDAVGTILLEQGYPAVGINAIARQAGCDKVLIYRYFGGFDELLLAFAETTTLWWEVDEIITETAADCALIALPDLLQILLDRYVTALESRPLALEIMAWEMSAQNNLTNALARTRGERGMELVKRIRGYYQQPNIDIGGILGVFGAAINYLVIRTRKQPQQYKTEEWWRLQQTIAKLLQAYA